MVLVHCPLSGAQKKKKRGVDFLFFSCTLDQRANYSFFQVEGNVTKSRTTFAREHKLIPTITSQLVANKRHEWRWAPLDGVPVLEVNRLLPWVLPFFFRSRLTVSAGHKTCVKDKRGAHTRLLGFHNRSNKPFHFL